MIYKPPSNIAKRCNDRSVFLAGSIEMNVAEDWQARISPLFEKYEFDIFNPRRDDWNASWVQTFTNPNFYQQVGWELNALDKCDIILMYFDPNTKSPISLLELGLYASSKKIYVVCPDGFWRKGNIEVVCDRYNIHIFDTLEDFEKYFISDIKESYVE